MDVRRMGGNESNQSSSESAEMGGSGVGTVIQGDFHPGSG